MDSNKSRAAKHAKEPPTVIHPHKASKNTSIAKVKQQLRRNPLITQQDLADKNGISKQAMNQLLKRHGVDVAALETYKEHRADIFAGKQEMVLSLIDTPAVIKMLDKAPMAAVNLFGVLFDKERLETGKSTANISTRLASAVMESDCE